MLNVSRMLDPRVDSRWAELVSRERGSVFGSPQWIGAIVDTYGFKVTADVVVDAAGRASAGLACADVRDLRGARLVSLPFCDYLDPICDANDAWNALLEPLLRQRVPLQLRVREAHVPLADKRFTPVNELAWHGTDLDRSEDEIFAAFDCRARQNIRSARRRGVSVHFGSDLEDVLAFHRFHRRTRKRKYRMLAQPVTFFENIWKAFAPHDGIVVGFATHEDEAIAASLYLMWNGTMYYKFGASTAERLSVRPNELLAWESLRLARERGCNAYDWGVSDIDQPGLVAYKRKFATIEQTVTVLRHVPPGYTNEHSADVARVFGDLTALMTRDDVSEDVTQRAGDLLYRYFC